MSEQRSPLQKALAVLPDDALVPVQWVRALARAEGPEQLVDLTVAQVARELGRSPATIRGWCGSGRIQEAYRLRGREWRIPHSALRQFFRLEASERNASAGSDGPHTTDLRMWRKEGRQDA